MVRQAGAREVHLRISCPPTMSPCFYGVDTPTKSELIAANQTVEEIRHFVGATPWATCRSRRCAKPWPTTDHDYCYACYTGDYPTELINIDELMASRPNR